MNILYYLFIYIYLYLLYLLFIYYKLIMLFIYLLDQRVTEMRLLSCCSTQDAVLQISNEIRIYIYIIYIYYEAMNIFIIYKTELHRAGSTFKE